MCLIPLAHQFLNHSACRQRRALNGFNVVEHLSRQYGWSIETFGPPRGVKGVLDHIRKELKEIESDPSDIMEWVDVIILACDGAMRAGHNPTAIVAAWEKKQFINEQRKWPDWRTSGPDKAIEHVRG